MKTTGLKSEKWCLTKKQKQYGRKYNSGTIIGKRFLEEQKKSIPIIVFAINKTSIKDNPNENEYYILEGINGLVPISLQQLQESFNIGEFRYFADGNRVPGILEGVRHNAK